MSSVDFFDRIPGSAKLANSINGISRCDLQSDREGLKGTITADVMGNP